MQNEIPHRTTRGRDWLIVAPRLLGVLAIFVALVRAASVAEFKWYEWIGEPISGTYEKEWVYFFYGSLPQNAAIVVLALVLIFATPLLVRLAYGPEEEPLPPSLRNSSISSAAPIPAGTDASPADTTATRHPICRPPC